MTILPLRQSTARQNLLVSPYKRKNQGIAFKKAHFLNGTELRPEELFKLLDLASQLKEERLRGIQRQDLMGQWLAMVFDKPSTRTRFSFTIAMEELGGKTIESLSSNRKHEEPEDFIRVIEGYCHAIMLRTYEHQDLEKMAKVSRIPVINGLTDLHHPCQVLADLLTLKEEFGELRGLNFTYVGDGNNMLHSLMLMLPLLGINVRYACPEGFAPRFDIERQAQKIASQNNAKVERCLSVEEAATNAHALYTDVWASMGQESESQKRELAFQGYGLTQAHLNLAAGNAIIMHCLPMEREKEISSELADGPVSRLFKQSENRLHAQKALLLALLGN